MNYIYKEIKNNPKDLIEVIIGDDKSEKFEVQQKIQRWDNEVNCSIRLKNIGIGEVMEENGKIKYIEDKIECHFYEIENASEFEVILKEKPETNVLEFSIQDKGVSYLYQPELTEWEKEHGFTRPENVVGSYAVYAFGKINYVGGKEYKSGKVGHIYRPRIIDSAGNEVWGVLKIDKGILSVTIPQEFLDKAIYPVKHAAGLTFGMTSQGASNGTLNGNAFTAMLGIPASSGTVDSWSFYGSGSATINIKGVIINSSKNILSNGVSPSASITTTSQWWTTNYSSKPSVTASATYYVGGIPESSTWNFAYDAGGASNQWYDASNSYTTPTNPTDGAAYTSQLSMYATYTEGSTVANNPTLLTLGVG